MRRILLVLLCVLIASCSQPEIKPDLALPKLPPPVIVQMETPAKTLEWHEFGDELFATAALQKKYVLVYLYADFCPHCQEMNKTFENPVVISMLNRSYLVTKINVLEQPEKAMIFYKGVNQAIPKTVFIKPHATKQWIIIETTGMLKPRKLLALLLVVGKVFNK